MPSSPPRCVCNAYLAGKRFPPAPHKTRGQVTVFSTVETEDPILSDFPVLESWHSCISAGNLDRASKAKSSSLPRWRWGFSLSLPACLPASPGALTSSPHCLCGPLHSLLGSKSPLAQHRHTLQQREVKNVISTEEERAVCQHAHSQGQSHNPHKPKIQNNPSLVRGLRLVNLLSRMSLAAIACGPDEPSPPLHLVRGRLL